MLKPGPHKRGGTTPGDMTTVACEICAFSLDYNMSEYITNN